MGKPRGGLQAALAAWERKNGERERREVCWSRCVVVSLCQRTALIPGTGNIRRDILVASSVQREIDRQREDKQTDVHGALQP